MFTGSAATASSAVTVAAADIYEFLPPQLHSTAIHRCPFTPCVAAAFGFKKG